MPIYLGYKKIKRNCNKPLSSFVFYGRKMILKNTRYNFLVNEHKNKIYGYAYFMLKNKMDAEDVTQEVLIKIWESLGKFKMSSAKAWIMKTTHNLCIDFLRRRQRVDKNEILFKYDGEENIVDEPDTGIYSRDFPDILTAELISQAIGMLPEKLRSVFVLYELDGLKYKEIAQALEIPVNSVKVYLLRARKELQKQLREIKTEREI